MPKLSSLTTSHTNTKYLRTSCCGRIKNSDCHSFFTSVTANTFCGDYEKLEERAYGAYRSKMGEKDIEVNFYYLKGRKRDQKAGFIFLQIYLLLDYVKMPSLILVGENQGPTQFHKTSMLIPNAPQLEN